MEHIAIIGNGISGITAARNIRKHSNARITIISSESEYFFSRTALMYVFMGQVRFEDTYPYEKEFYFKNRLDLVFDKVETIDFQNRSLDLENSSSINYDKLILALGSVPRKLGISGENLDGIQGLYSKQDLEQLESKRDHIKKAVVVGGGLIGVELTEMLHYAGSEVDFLIRESAFWANVLSLEERDFIGKHIESKGIRLHFNEEVERYEGENSVNKLITKSGKEIETDFVGETIGVRPNVDFLKNTELEIGKGILINEYFETNQTNVYAIGDCAEHRKPIEGRGNVEQIWYTGKIMGEQLGKNLARGVQEAYDPGPWFNSAKFFDIEFQNYGYVPSELKEDQAEFIWKKKDKMLRFVFERDSERFVGINAINMKFRHPVFDHWLRKQVLIDEIIEGLSTANFDGEFSKNYEDEIVQEYNQQFEKIIKLKKKMWYEKLIKR